MIRIHLAAELGLDPGAELQHLHAALLRGEELQPPAWSASRTRIWNRPAQLPPDIVGFTGRARELAQLDASLPAGASEPPALLIWSIEGPAGVGKTALAVHWAHQARSRFTDGQLHVDLQGYAPAEPVGPNEALVGFLRALNIPAEQVPTSIGQAAALYRSLLADRRVLVVVNNARDSEQVRPLLPAGRGCAVIVTSRRTLTGLVARDGARRLVRQPHVETCVSGRLN